TSLGISVCFIFYWQQEEKSKGKVADFRPNILMLGLLPPDYVLRAVSNVHTNDLEQTLLVRAVSFVH
ncbi:WD repeat-containing 3, partial [Olea europaea subsp. europaea]